MQALHILSDFLLRWACSRKWLAPIYIPLSSYSAYTLGLAALLALVILNTFGVVLSEMGQHILIVCTVFPLIATTIMCFTKADFNNLVPFAPHGFTNVLKATRVIIFGFFGFECATLTYLISSKNHKKMYRSALTYSIALVGTLYILFVGSILLSTPLSYFTDPRMPLSDTLQLVFPRSTMDHYDYSHFYIVCHFGNYSFNDLGFKQFAHAAGKK